MKSILTRESGLYTGRTEDGEEVLVKREKGNGYTVMYPQQGKQTYWCVDYDEDGNPECEYPMY